VEGNANDSQRPILAVLTMSSGENQFRGNSANFTDIIKTGRRMGFLVYIVTAKDLKLTAKKVVGYTYTDAGGWQQQSFPLPHIIYNRIPSREDEQTAVVQKTLQECMRHSKIYLFNPAFFNKWTLFEWLKRSKKTKQYIPATRRLRSREDLEKLLQLHPVLYLKPEKGKAGMGIMRISRLSSKTFPYQVTMQMRKGSVSYKCDSLDKLWKRVDRAAGSEEYIMQQGIELAHIDQRPFDLRILVQKNHKGKWSLTGIGARLAGSLSITTHVPRGGSIQDPEQMLSTVFGPDAAKKILQRAKTAALLIAKQIERKSSHLLGEMSMDLGVDLSGKIWFFEANSKPMKFDEPHIRKKSLERLFHYALYLHKYKPSKRRSG
jgi:hypothetical protein